MRPMELQFITHFTDTYSYYDSARMALEGGCRWIQLRMKDASSAKWSGKPLRLQRLCKDYGATFHHRRPRRAGQEDTCRRSASG